MNIPFYLFLFLFGTLFGSFASVLIYRCKSGEKGIFTGRSHCAKCEKILNAIELIPVLSWVINKGKCKNCKKQISQVYPILEISMGILFALIGYFLIDLELIASGNKIEIIKLLFWLSIGFITIVYTFYDILFLEIHEKILMVGTGIILLFLALQTLIPGFNIINTLPNSIESLTLGITSIIIALITIGGLYVIMLKELPEVVDIIILIGIILVLYLFNNFSGIPIESIPILNGSLGALGIFLFFFIQIVISKGKWMGGGDLRIAIMIGLILGASLSLAGVMLTYLVGSIVGIFYILESKIRHGWKSPFNSQVPFGPFLAAGFFIAVFYQKEVLNFIEVYFGMM